MEPAATLEEIAQLAERRHRDPASVLQRVSELMARDDDPRVDAAGDVAAGLALQELGRIEEAAERYRRAIETSVAHGLIDQEAVARAQLAISLLNLGHAAQAEEEAMRARALATPGAAGVVEMLYGLILQRTGRHAESLAAYRRALRALERAGDVTSIARLRLNRGIVFAYRGHLAAALDDLAEAERIAGEQDLPLLAAMSAHNVAFTHGRRGALPDALAAFDRAERAYQALETQHRLLAVLQADRCQMLLLAGLVTDARVAAQAAVEALEDVGDLAYGTECRLLLARALLAEGEYADAVAQATLAADGFRSAGWPTWVALARYVAVQAEVLAIQDERGLPPAPLLERCREIARELDTQGWPVEALHVRTFVGRLALALDRPAVAREELAHAAAVLRRSATVSTPDLRAQAWHATALLRLAEDDPAGAKRALSRGMAIVDEYRATLGATELRANAASHSADLARLGTRLALDSGRAVDVLRWAERWRAGALRAPPVRPPDDGELAGQLAELRRLRAEMAEPSRLRQAAPPSAQARATALEEAIRSRIRQLKDDRAVESGRIDVAALKRALGDRTLVEYVALEQRLHAVVVTARRARLVDLGPTEPVEAELRYLAFALRRLLAGGAGGAAVGAAAAEAAEQMMAGTAARLFQLLVAPLRLDEDAPLVLVPTGMLHGLTWPALPGLAGRAVTIAPSAALWLGASTRPHRSRHERRVALVAGPHLPGAEAEVRALAELYGDADVLVGPEATAANVLAAMANADLVHLAAHGHFRSDSPLFSSVLLADGPVTVYDLESLDLTPELVVLSACDAAVADVRSGDELLGTSAALLGLGVPAVIAPVLAVADEPTVAMMVLLHQRLRAGERPASALAQAAAHHDDRTAAAAFICVGGNDAG